MPAAWNVLVVDDERDIHDVTKLALKRKSWRGRPLALTHALSGAEARELLMKPGAHFHAALVDVVMETENAGLELCDFIRSNVPRVTRIVLRTGQPGVAPPEQVLNDYDIDYYLAKTEVTDARLFTVLRACFRSSIDIATLQHISQHLKSLTAALQEATTTRETLAQLMAESLRFLDDKYSAHLALVHDVKMPPRVAGFDPDALARAVRSAHAKKATPLQLLPGADFGLPADQFLIMTARLPALDKKQASVTLRIKQWLQSAFQEDEADDPVGIAVRFDQPLPERTLREFVQDIELFIANWRVVEAAWRLQDRVLRERMEMAKSVGGV
jgi:CheY-like chemotaxis protein